MTTVEAVPAVDADERAADLVLARLHLRLGSLGLARAELETLAGRNALDDQGIRDLAEARWRTGDLAGAGEAAAAYLEVQPDDVLALVISAEMQAHLGRPGEARRLANRALAGNQGPIDALFAGMPRSSVWPVDSGGPVEPAGTLFADLAAPAPTWAVAAADADVGSDAGPTGGSPATVDSAPEAAGAGLWDAHDTTVAQALPDATELVARARAALAADRPGQAAAALALALRAEPSLAPTVLEMMAGRVEPVLALVRGDAHRIVGHEAEARRDYAAAVAAIGLERRSDEGRRAEDVAFDNPETRPDADPGTDTYAEPTNLDAQADDAPWPDDAPPSDRSETWERHDEVPPRDDEPLRGQG